MAESTLISWADHTWSPWIGCTKVSPACDGCYAEHLMDTRMGRVEWGPHGERSRTSASYWKQLRRWNEEAFRADRLDTVFPSLCDPFDNQVEVGWRREFFNEIAATPNLIYLLLTKRPQNIVKMAAEVGIMPSNIALGATCEDQERADTNVPHLLRAKELLHPAFVFLSCEPLLGPIDLTSIEEGEGCMNALQPALWEDEWEQWRTTEKTEEIAKESFCDWFNVGEIPTGPMHAALDWVITGGETDQGKHKARPTHPKWLRSLRDQCAKAGVPFHHKQNGEWIPTGHPTVKGEAVVWPNGSPDARDANAGGGGGCEMVRVGKKRSGRLLDGVEHNAFPAMLRKAA